MIEVKNLTKRYGSHTAIRDLNFTVEAGKIYGFLGPNGAGKSTTMNIIAGCLSASEGSVLINGHDIYEEPAEAKKCIGYLPEMPPLYSDMTPAEYLRFVAEAKGIARDEIGPEIAYVTELTQLEDVSDRLIRNLSKGYKQRVGIAQAMIGSPEIIILDEPTVGLDPIQIIEIRDLIRSLGKEHTVILSSHILSEVSAVCDHVIIIANGRVAASDTLDRLTKSSSTVRVTVKGREKEVREIADNIREAEQTEMEASTEGANIWELSFQFPHGLDMREKIFRLFAQANLPLLKLISEENNLENIFLQLTEEYASETDAAPETDASQETDTAAENAREERDGGGDDEDPYTPLFKS